MTPQAQDYDVAIVGYGPVGACLANLLGLLGITTLILDREGPAYHLPRAVHFDDEIMRVLQTVGIADEMAKYVHVNPGMRFVDADGRLLLDWPRPPEVSAQGWHPSYRFHQPDLERLLRQALGRFDCVKVATRCNVTAVEDDGQCAALAFDNLATGQQRTVTAKYVVGCDGARSFVRDVIGSGIEDYGFHERWLVVDALLKQPKPELGDFSIQHCDATRPATYVRGTGNRRRWEITVRPEEESDEVVTPEGTWRLLERWLTPAEADLERAAVYTFHSVIATRWRQGRVLIAGDAAHQTPPFMGQGLCAGMRDAANLAWKLAHCVRHGIDDEMLDSYQSERHAHVRAYVETALKLGRLINQDDPKQALEAGFRQPDGSAKMSSIAPRLGPGFAAGDRDHCGTLAPQLQLLSGARLDDVAGYSFQLLSDTALLSAAGMTGDTFAKSGVHLVQADETSVGVDYLASLPAKAVLIRPDRYILGTAQDASGLRALHAAVQDVAHFGA
ncbi:MAG: bifunctional 3-(3-hydroxy-phenyl)propionate/3-hydroxycinnamic acid hydroxylase [Hyphomicrobiaceae bacterium]